MYTDHVDSLRLSRSYPPGWTGKVPRKPAGLDKGYVLFQCDWKQAAPYHGPELRDLQRWRTQLHRLNLVGVNPDGIGFGNLSCRLPQGQEFLISGTATGRHRQLGPEHFTRVTQYDYESNSLTCEGPIKASSESLSHAAVYGSYRGAKGVIHVHHAGMWEQLRGKIPTTDAAAQAGTPEMAYAIQELFEQGDVQETGLFVMGGHTDGLMAFGATMERAGSRIVRAYRDL